MRFPPVFTWPVGKRPSEQSEDSDDQMDTLSAPESDKETQSLDEDTIKHVCSHIDGALQESDRDRRRRIYEEASAMSFFEVDKAISQRWAISFSTIISAGQDKETNELPPWEKTLKEVVSGLCRLFNFFIPLGYPCVIADKFWGAINDLVTIIPQICDTFGMLELTERTRHPNMPALFYIVDITSEEHADLRDMADVDVLIKDITLCNKCEKSRAYSTQSDAWGHLFKYHFKASSKQREVIISRSQWVMDHGEYLTFTCRNDVQRLLNELEDYITSLERMASQIQHGVSENGKFDRDTYKIPSSLVDAFQNFVIMVVTGANAVKSSYQLREVYTDVNSLPTVINFLDSDKITNLATEAEEAMGNAMKDIVLMTFTNEESGVVTYQAVSPSLVITLLLGDIRYSNHGNLHLIGIYEKYIQFLQFKAGDYPSRRLMQEIYTFREELLMVEKVAEEQRQILNDYRSVLRPSTFRITTESRISSFELENRRLSKLLDRIDEDCELIQTLLNRLESIATQTRNGVEVRQEDQGKAILVFTIVTVIFMPLSFVTSYLGMNTNDIRNMENSQKLFWIVSIPLTVFIIAAILLVAFQVDRLREALEILFSRDYVQPLTKSANSLSGEEERREDQKGNEFFHSLPSVGSSSKQWFRRRRGGKWMATSTDSSFA
ncbi:hypothetical protein N7520_000850 [Penicillium odoratum]|uniref:uncharacterized protein n=1 Tax=Penicillium odoratum TaxID=1167516 RepID=UPI00254801CB|nr:uncharacterized protein N7520_000850 [Penicillium odoratum]KAJ5777604.1 hypothetical protein N7520_000850 [Penicillium odoratum]